MISNLPNTANGGSTISDTGWKAMLFTTGSSPRQLASVVVGLNPNPTTESTPFTQNVKVSLFSVSGGNPHTELLTTGLVSVTMPARQGLYTFLDASSFTMSLNTQYALVLSSDASTIKWGANGNSSTTPTASAGFAYDAVLQSSDAGVSWTTSPATNNAFAISVVPMAPVISPAGGTFVGSTTVELSAEVGTQIYYTLDGSEPTTGSSQYAGPFAVGVSGTVRALASANGEVGPETTADFVIGILAAGLTIDAIPNQVYTGAAIKPARVVKDGSTTLTAGTNYTVAYADNVDAGTATVTITGAGAYRGTKTTTFAITPAPLTITGLAGVHKVYDGATTATATGTAALNGVISGDVGDVSLAGTPTYTFANKNMGTGISVTTAGFALDGSKKDNYSLSQPTLSADITPKPINDESITIDAIADQAYTGSAIEPAVVVKDDNTLLVLDTDYTMAYAGNTEVGTAATITISGKGNYGLKRTVMFGITGSGPDAPTDLTAVAGDGQVSLSWQAPEDDGGAVITGYTVTSVPSGSCQTTSLSCVITGLTNGTEYTVTLRAINAVGAGATSEPITATPTAGLSAPTNVVLTPGTGFAWLNFKAPTRELTHFSYRFTSPSDDTWISVSATDAVPPIRINELENSVQVCVELRAHAEDTDSAPTTAVCATPFEAATKAPDVEINIETPEVPVEACRAENAVVLTFALVLASIGDELLEDAWLNPRGLPAGGEVIAMEPLDADRGEIIAYGNGRWLWKGVNLSPDSEAIARMTIRMQEGQ